jgi:ABC-2 type transport system permease protein
MAELNAELAPQASGRWSMNQTRAQFLAIAWLRWRMLINGFRRKGGTGELIGRILIYPLLAVMAIGPSVGVAFAAFFFTQSMHLERIVWLLWGAFAYCQVLNIQLGQQGSTFDPTQLIRFPLSTRAYVYIRLCFGLLTPGNVIVTLMSFSVAFGIVLAAPRLWLYALLGLAIFASTNVLFSRMIFAWVDRWLSTRRAREVFTGFIFAFSLAIQWANLTFNPAYNHHHGSAISAQRLQFGVTLYHRLHPLLAWFPPELTASSLVAANEMAISRYVELTLGCALYAAVFFIVFALRMRTEFRGENLSDAANGVSRSALKPSSRSYSVTPVAPVTTAALTFNSNSTSLLPAMLLKEFIYVKRHSGILYGLIMPIFLVLILAGRVASSSNAAWVFPAAVGYTLLAISPLCYNSFGFEGAGVQFYFLAPVLLRDVLLAKNLFNFAMAAVEIVAIFGIICYVASVPTLQTAIMAVLWAAGTLLINTAVGNRRSITAPKKVNPQRMANRQTSQLSAMMALGILVLSSGIAAGLIGGAYYFNLMWALIPISAAFAAAGLFVYERSLRSIDRFALDHREELFAELCKAG